MRKRYEFVKSTLRDRIEGGVYARGTKIPSGVELEREFGVSTITVRRALHDLQVEGWLSGHQGLGVFVSERPHINRTLNPAFIKSLGEEMRRAGVEPGIRELSFTLLIPDATTRTALRLRSGSSIYKHERLILADDRVVGLDMTYLPRKLGDRIGADLAHEFLMPLLDKHSIIYDSVRYQLEACALTERDAPKLGLPAGLPLLSINYMPFEPSGRPLFLGHMLTRAEWFSYEFIVHPNQTRERSRIERTASAGRAKKPEASNFGRSRPGAMIWPQPNRRKAQQKEM